MEDYKFAKEWQDVIHKPSNIKKALRDKARNILLNSFARFNQFNDSNFLRGIYCHYVFDNQKEDFENILIQLKKFGKFINTEQCLKILNGTEPLNGKYFHLSFDDGFRNNFTNALPILKRLEIPAIFFVPSSYIGADWESTKKYCIETTNYKTVIEMLKLEDLKQMIALGYEIGSHTKSHARFSEISSNIIKMIDEIKGSKNELEQMLGVECNYISWPYGKITDADIKSLHMVEESGYKACFGAYRGSVIPNNTNIFSIPRHHFEVQWPISHILYFLNGNFEKAL